MAAFHPLFSPFIDGRRVDLAFCMFRRSQTGKVVLPIFSREIVGFILGEFGSSPPAAVAARLLLLSEIAELAWCADTLLRLDSPRWPGG